MPRYRAYGLAIDSDLALPELAADGAPGEPDVRVRLGGVPARVESPVEERVTWAARPGLWVHEVAGVARYAAHDGREVRVEPTGGSPADVRAFLLASALGAVLQQRGRFALCASAAAGPAGAVLVAGAVGAGTSTALVELGRRGVAALSDGLAVVRFGEGGPEVVPGAPAVRLWRDAVVRMGEAPEALEPVRDGLEQYVVRPAAFRPDPAPLRAAVVLQPAAGAEAVTAERLDAHRSLQAVLLLTARRRIVRASGHRVAHFRWAARLAGAVPVVHVRWPSYGETVGAVADAIERVLAEAAAVPVA